MKHAKDLNQKELDILTDATSTYLSEAFKFALTNFNLCPDCFHHIVIKMCEAYLSATNPGPNHHVH